MKISCRQVSIVSSTTEHRQTGLDTGLTLESLTFTTVYGRPETRKQTEEGIAVLFGVRHIAPTVDEMRL